MANFLMFFDKGTCVLMIPVSSILTIERSKLTSSSVKITLVNDETKTLQVDYESLCNQIAASPASNVLRIVMS